MGERQRKDVNHKNSHSLISHWMCVWADSAPTHSVLRAFSFIRPYSSSVLLYSRKQQPTSGVLTHSFSLSLCMCFSLFIDFSYAAAAPHSGISAFISQWPRLYHRMVDTVHDDEISSVKFPLRICPQLSKCMGKLGTSEYRVCVVVWGTLFTFFSHSSKVFMAGDQVQILGCQFDSSNTSCVRQPSMQSSCELFDLPCLRDLCEMAAWHLATTK